MRILIFIFVVALFLISCTVETPSEKSEIIVNEPQQTETTQPIDTIPSTIECYNDEDCGGREIIGDTNCFQGNVQGTVKVNKCVNPGKQDSYCDSETKTGIIEECPEVQFCKQGECLDYACTDSDGGLNFTVKGTVTINDGNVYEDKCDKDVLTEYYCSADNRAFSEKKTCPGECSKGACKEAD